ncbi:MAG: MucR family transcriptional regulator [Rhodospirillaceae bacterium]|nr:MucR family transcriptional regulator [Rhodospirillaceae bacterium]
MSSDKQERISEEEMLRMTASVVSAYVGNNNLPPTDIPDVIKTVYGSLTGLGRTAGGGDAPKPAVPVRRSVTPDYIVCLEDGRKLKMLKRHLRTTYNMTIDQYRQKWGLPLDYPVVAPNYARQRSAFAKRIGLGRRAARPSRAGAAN